MKFSYKKIVVTALAVMALIACTKSLYEPNAGNTAKNADITQLKQGRELYVNKCGKCHELFSPNKYNKADWGKWVDRMAPKSKLTAEEKAKVLAYVTKGK